MLLFLLLLNIIFPLGTIATSWRREGVVLKHTHLFAFAYLFYWILPIGLGVLIPPRMLPIHWVMWTSLVQTVPRAAMTEFLIAALFCYGAFMLGDSLARRFTISGLERRLSLSIPSDGFIAFLFLLTPIWLGLLFALRHQLFHGYTDMLHKSVGATLQGTYVATCTVFLVVTLFCGAREEVNWDTETGRRLIRLRWLTFTIYVVALVFALSLGQRMPVVTGVVAWLVYRSSFVRPLKKSWIGIGVLVGGLTAGAFAMLRQAAIPSIAGSFQTVLTEPVFVSFSLVFFLAHYTIPLLKFPWLLLSGLVDLVPTLLYPDKMHAVLKMHDVGYLLFSPGGGVNSFVSFMANFGILGTLVVLFLFGVALRILSNMGSARVFRVMYSMICGFLAFSFFRDPFFQSIIKEFFEFSFVTPLLMLLTLHVIWCLGRLPELRSRSLTESSTWTLQQ